LGALAPNTTYYIRVYTYGSTSWIHSFNICVSLGAPPPANDTYFTAASFSINPGETCTPSITGGSTEAATAEHPNDCNGNLPKDVWYKFTALSPLAHIQIPIKFIAGNISSNSTLWMQAFEGSNSAPTLMCSNNGILDFDGHNAATTLKPGHIYYIRVYNDEPGNACSFDLCTQGPLPPSYDECSKAVTITISPDETCSKGVRLSNLNATPSSNSSSCIGTVGSDVWLKFTAPSPLPPGDIQVEIKDYLALTGITNPLMAMEVYSGNCGSLTPVLCNLGTAINVLSVTAGQTYYIRIISADGQNAGNFTVCLHTKPPAVTNVSCATAMALNTSANASAQFIHTSTVGALQDNTLTDCGNNKFVFSNAVWF